MARTHSYLRPPPHAGEERGGGRRREDRSFDDPGVKDASIFMNKKFIGTLALLLSIFGTSRSADAQSKQLEKVRLTVPAKSLTSVGTPMTSKP